MSGSSDLQETATEQVYVLFQQAGLAPRTVAAFQRLIYQYYRKNGRVFPWRQTSDPYHIVVSEIMLQQTQTSRVVKRYEDFIALFPDFSSLAFAPLQNILQAWQGLGYNRRAIVLQRIAQTVVSSFDGQLPSTPEVLATLPGIGRYTASAIAALAFNQPTAFIETNIRTVFLYFFFRDTKEVADRDISPIVEATLDRANPREWYYALFDYGAMLKRKEKLSATSAHYRKQSPFKGSNRELRGQILRLLLANSAISEDEVIKQLNHSPVRIKKNLQQMQKEGFIAISGDMICIK